MLVAAGIAAAVSRGGTGGRPNPKALALTGPLAAADGSALEATAPAAMPLGVTPTYEFPAALADLGPRAPVWRLAGSGIDTDRVSTWADALGVDGAVEQLADGGQRGLRVVGKDAILGVLAAPTPWLSYQRGTVADGATTTASGAGGSATVGPDGSVTVTSAEGEVCTSATTNADGTTSVAPCGPTVEPPSRSGVRLPTLAETRAVGERILADLGVLDGTWEFAVRDGAGFSVATSCSAGIRCRAPAAREYLTSRALVATRTIGGQPVAGTEWTVDVGDEGVIDSVQGPLGTLEPVGDFPLETPRAAFDRGTNPSGPVPEPAIACAPGSCPSVTITVEGVSLRTAVWLGGQAGTRYVVPIYHFTGRASDDTPWSRDVIALTDAALAPGLRDDASPPTIPAPIPGAIPGATKPCRTPNEVCAGGTSGPPTSGSAVP